MRLLSPRAALGALLTLGLLAGPAAARPVPADLAPPPAADGERIARTGWAAAGAASRASVRRAPSMARRLRSRMPPIYPHRTFRAA